MEVMSRSTLCTSALKSSIRPHLKSYTCEINVMYKNSFIKTFKISYNRSSSAIILFCGLKKDSIPYMNSKLRKVQYRRNHIRNRYWNSKNSQNWEAL